MSKDTTSGITRAQYMADSSRLHHLYYAQFVTPGLQSAVGRRIGVDRINDSTDPYMNDIPLREWDALKDLVFSYSLSALRKMDACGGSLSDAVCIAKAAARNIKQVV